MLVFVSKRIGYMVFTMVAVSLLVFLLLEINVEGVAVGVLGPYSTDEQRNLWLEANGYFRPAYIRYFEWVSRFFTGDMGDSVRFRVPVSDILWERLWNTAILGFWAMAIIIPMSLVLGVLAGMKEGSPQDRALSFLCILTVSVPEFATATFFSAIFVFGLNWLPGISAMSDGFDWVQLILPVAVLVTYDFGYVVRGKQSFKYGGTQFG